MSNMVICSMVVIASLFLFFGHVHAEQKKKVITREQCIECVMHHIDVAPKDGFVTLEEIDKAKREFLNALERGMSRWVEPNETILKHCDIDNDGKISREDMIRSNSTDPGCLKDRYKMEMFWERICERADKRERAAASSSAIPTRRP